MQEGICHKMVKCRRNSSLRYYFGDFGVFTGEGQVQNVQPIAPSGKHYFCQLPLCVTGTASQNFINKMFLDEKKVLQP